MDKERESKIPFGATDMLPVHNAVQTMLLNDELLGYYSELYMKIQFYII